MSDEYLWDRSGEPDPEIERLEKLLSPFRYREKQLPSSRCHPRGGAGGRLQPRPYWPSRRGRDSDSCARRRRRRPGKRCGSRDPRA